MLTHSRWVYPFQPSVAGLTRANAPAYTRLCLPFEVLCVMAQIRVGWVRLEVQAGRLARPKVPRGQRLCKLCAANPEWRQLLVARVGAHSVVEDTLHFVLECPAYDGLRDNCAAYPLTWRHLLRGAELAAGCMVRIFTGERQSSLAHTLFRMLRVRSGLLELS